MSQETDVKALIEELELLYNERLQLVQRKQGAIEEVLAPVREKLDEVENDYGVFLEDLAGTIERQEERLKSWVLLHGATVKSGRLTAVYRPGRVTWDTKALDGYAAAHPELLPFRKTGQPSASITWWEE